MEFNVSHKANVGLKFLCQLESIQALKYMEQQKGGKREKEEETYRMPKDIIINLHVRSTGCFST